MNTPARIRIDRCFDSHVHLLGTGMRHALLDLRKLGRSEDILKCEITPRHRRGEWIIGRGWDQNCWPDKKMPRLTVLDQLSPNNPVCFHRVDGHALWANTRAIEFAGGAKVFEAFASDAALRDDNGQLTGVFIDNAMGPVVAKIPSPDKQETKIHLLEGMRRFHQAGFTHIRELTCDRTQFDLLTQLENEKKLGLAIELFFHSKVNSPFEAALEAARYAKENVQKYLRVKGIKFFYDGALGSEGALLSCCYPSGHSGLRLMQPQELRELLIETWAHGLEPAIHVIGDQAAHEVTAVIHEIAKSRKISRFHLEHAEILRPDTIALLKTLPATLHFQPCHWHTDKRWLKEKVGALFPHIFPIAAVEKEDIQFYFGSDSPIEEPSVHANHTALEELAKLDFQPMKSPFKDRHQHPDKDWVKSCWTEFEDYQPHKVFFEEKLIYSREEIRSRGT
jgi:predicted amidohydrolase YtcJ